MTEHYNVWENCCKTVLREKFLDWHLSTEADLENGNPIYGLYNPDTLKATKIVYGSELDLNPYGMWIKLTTMDNLLYDSVGEYVFRYKETDSKTLEAFNIFFSIWTDEETNYDFMKTLIERFQKPVY